MAYHLDNLTDKQLLTNTLVFCSLYISLYESMMDFVEMSIAGLFGVESSIIDGALVFDKKSNTEYKELFLNRTVAKIGDKTVKNEKKAQMLWLFEQGCISMEEYDSFVAIMKKRNDYAHELGKKFLEGIFESEITLLSKMFGLYKKITVWWWNTFDAEICDNRDTIQDNEKHPIIIDYFETAFETIGIKVL